MEDDQEAEKGGREEEVNQGMQKVEADQGVLVLFTG